jgi:methionyl-tRNA formyltransferase
MVAARRLRVAFFGTPDFAVPTLDALLASRHEVVAVITQPDRPRGRGQKTSPSPVKRRATAAAVPVLQPETIRDPQFLDVFGRLSADLAVVAAYGKILPESLLAIPPLGMINVHASILPRHRGAAPVHRAIISGDRETGVTIMRVVKALDAGPMLAVSSIPIPADATSAELERQLAALGGSLLAGTVDRIADGPVPEIAQDESAATYAPRLTREDGLVTWDRPAVDIHNQIRGLHPWPLASTTLRGSRLILRRSRVPGVSTSAPPGTVVAAKGDDLRVATPEGDLMLIELQAEGRRPMPARDFLAGHGLAAGTRLGA